MSGLTWRVKVASGLVAVVAGPLALSARPASAATQQVMLGNLRFSPAHIEIVLGDTVDWVAGDDGHTVTARDGTFDSSPRGLMSEGDEFRYRFRVPGTFAYYCRMHGSKGMQGEIVVIDPSAPTTTTTTTRLTPVTAAATTTSTAATTTSAAPETTTTSRPLATSSTTSLAMATPTALPGTPALPQEAVPLNPNARVVGSPIPSADLPESQAAARRPGGSGSVPAAAAVGVALVGLLGAGGLAARRRRRHSA
ncbi:MAG TPA: plastocyanin/azurin family copper-binding protein [Acidimicrobiia bacterium]